MRKIKVMVDKTSYTDKPTQYDVAGIQNRLKNSSTIEEIDPLYLIHYATNGYTIRPSILKDGASEKDFQQQEVIYIDIDNKEGKPVISLKEILLKLNNYGLNAFGYYYTFSHCEEYPRFRIIFILEKPITDINEMDFILKVLNNILPNADTSCASVAKLYYGTNGEAHILDHDAEITFEDIVRISEEFVIDDKKISISNHSNNHELNELINNFNLFEYVSKDYNNFRKSGNAIYFKDCPICGHQNCFVIYTNTNTFYCFGANGGQGGNIINYLSITKKLSIPQAIDYFKYEILGLPKEKINKEKYKDISDIEQKYLEEIKQKLEKYNLNINTIDDISWLEFTHKGKNIEVSVICPELAEYIHNNLHYFFIESTTDNKVLKYIYEDGYYKQITDTKLKSTIKKFIPKRLIKSQLIDEVFKLLTTDDDCYVTVAKLNRDINIINFKDGLYHFDTGELTPHTPEYYSTIQINCNYPREIKKPKTGYFDNYINTLTSGNQSEIKLLLQFGGVSISNIPGYYMKAGLFLIGLSDTGKSKYIELVNNIVGEKNTTTIDFTDLEKPFHAIKLLGKRLASFADMSIMKTKSISRFKMITGGDTITDCFKGRDLVDFKFLGTLLFSGNEMPKWAYDKGEYIFKRMIFIEPKNVIPEEQQDKELLKKLLDEKEYIISLFLEGARQVIANGYKYDIPPSCLESRKKYRLDNDSVLSFINECMERVIREPERTDLTTGQIYELYVKWCKYNNNESESIKSFASIMKKHLGIINPLKKHFNGNTYYPGIIPTEDALKTYWKNDRY